MASIAKPWVFEKLVTLDAAGELSPLLADRIERVSGDLIRVHLRLDATFSDGTPVTADDVVRSLQPTGLRVTPSDGGLLIESRERGLPADALLLQTHVFRESGGRFMGSGPFAVAAKTGTELHLVRRHAEAGRINDVYVAAYATPRDAFVHTLKGDANAIVDLESRWLEFFRGVPSLQIVRAAGHNADAIMLNSKLARTDRVLLAQLLASPQVRDRAYADAECMEKGGTNQAPVPPGAPLRILSWGPFERLALAARRALGERGGDVAQLAPEEVLARLRAGDFEMVTARPLRWPLTLMALVWRSDSPENLTGYSNPEMDRAIDARDWVAANAVLRDDPPVAFICTRDQLAVIDARIKNPRLGPFELLETLPEWETEQ
ncbi:MAG TPA: ABC transporter substrate-binding protein [Myxococcales bacterium]|nr:ABC transporter substrate-binding protein [Myxococcales bacterium]